MLKPAEIVLALVVCAAIGLAVASVALKPIGRALHPPPQYLDR